MARERLYALLLLAALVGVGCVNRGGTYDSGSAVLSVLPASIPADGLTRAQVTLQLNVGGGFDVAGLTATLISQPGDLQIEPFGGPTPNGTFTAAVSGRRVGTYTLSATLDSAQTNLPLMNVVSLNMISTDTLPLGVPSTSQSSLSAQPSTVAADGTTFTTLTVIARDRMG